jgi:hypothetical protein
VARDAGHLFICHLLSRPCPLSKSDDRDRSAGSPRQL